MSRVYVACHMRVTHVRGRGRGVLVGGLGFVDCGLCVMVESLVASGLRFVVCGLWFVL